MLLLVLAVQRPRGFLVSVLFFLALKRLMVLVLLALPLALLFNVLLELLLFLRAPGLFLGPLGTRGGDLRVKPRLFLLEILDQLIDRRRADIEFVQPLDLLPFESRGLAQRAQQIVLGRQFRG